MTVQRMAGAIVLLLTAAAPASAQRAARLVADSAGKLGIVLCNIRPSGKVGDGQKAFKTGIEDKDAAKRTAALEQAVRILTEQTGTGGAAAWYYLGRAFLAQGDLAGADSALSKAEMMQPDCEIDINNHRQQAWAVLANAGIEKLQGNDLDSALVLFRQASTMFRGLPHVFENMGVIYANNGQNDSAAHYFGRAAEIAAQDSTLTDNRNQATLNQAMVLQRLERHDEAITVLRRYLEWKPGDTDARKSLSWSLRQAGQAASADSLDRAMVDEFARMNFDSLTANDLMAVGVSMFNAEKFPEAAQIFERLMRRNPWSRDAVYNLANAYLALKQWDSLSRVGKQLLLIEPLNEDGYRLLGQAYRALERQDSLIKMAETLVMLPLNVQVTNFNMSSQSARFQATATGRRATDAASKDLPPVAVTLQIEFLDSTGTVLGSEDVAVPALQPGTTHEVTAQARAPGIVGWRYRRK